MLPPYIFEHLGPTRRVGISLAFPYGLYCPFVDRYPSSRCRTRRTSRRLPYLRSIEGAAAPAPAARDVSRPCQQTVHAKGIHLRLLTCTLMSQGLFTMLTLCFSVSIGSFWSTPQCICSGLAPSAALVPWPSTQARTRLQTGMRWRGPPADRDARCLRQAHGHLRPGQHRPGAAQGQVQHRGRRGRGDSAARGRRGHRAPAALGRHGVRRRGVLAAPSSRRGGRGRDGWGSARKRPGGDSQGAWRRQPAARISAAAPSRERQGRPVKRMGTGAIDGEGPAAR